MPIMLTQDSICTKDNSFGFNLVELMITVAIAGIMVAIAVPSFKTSIRSSRLTTSANAFISALNLARSEAIKRGAFVTVRKVDDNSSSKISTSAAWDDGWDIFTDADGDGIFENGDNNLKTFAALDATYTLRGNNGNTFKDSITFDSSGRSVNNGSFVGGMFILCDNSDGNMLPEANTAKLIMLNRQGRINLGGDNNTDNIPNTDSTAGSNITSCTPS